MDTYTSLAEWLCDQANIEGMDQCWLTPGEFSQSVLTRDKRTAAKATDLYIRKLMRSLDSIQDFLKDLSYSTSDCDATTLWLYQGRVDRASKFSQPWECRKFGIRLKKGMR